jgi:hypothetical protein
MPRGHSRSAPTGQGMEARALRHPSPGPHPMIASAQLGGELADRLGRITAPTGLSTADVIRQGLIRIISEVEAMGSLTCHPLPPATQQWLQDAPPRRRKSRERRTGLSLFEEPLLPRQHRTAAPATKADVDRHHRLACEAIGF